MLADKLREARNKHTLEVGLRSDRRLDFDQFVVPEKFIAKSRGKGRVRTVDHSSGQVLELTVCSHFLPVSTSSLTWVPVNHLTGSDVWRVIQTPHGGTKRSVGFSIGVSCRHFGQRNKTNVITLRESNLPTARLDPRHISQQGLNRCTFLTKYSMRSSATCH